MGYSSYLIRHSIPNDTTRHGLAHKLESVPPVPTAALGKVRDQSCLVPSLHKPPANMPVASSLKPQSLRFDHGRDPLQHSTKALLPDETAWAADMHTYAVHYSVIVDRDHTSLCRKSYTSTCVPRPTRGSPTSSDRVWEQGHFEAFERRDLRLQHVLGCEPCMLASMSPNSIWKRALGSLRISSGSISLYPFPPPSLSVIRDCSNPRTSFSFNFNRRGLISMGSEHKDIKRFIAALWAIKSA
ncbi:hypothetical protein F4780DRAFT_227916 [Xylariomycetidae sp. FL0641]|nr:hypothetical protein F4780DRAFT_227916 [Xylariomycetidae sp. FL0641]